MSFDTDLLSMMGSAFAHHPITAHDVYGAPQVGQITTNVPCHVTYQTKIIRGDAEENAVSTAQIECPPGGLVVNGVTVPTIGVDDHVILADGAERRILQITSYTDDTGTWHQSAALT